MTFAAAASKVWGGRPGSRQPCNRNRCRLLRSHRNVLKTLCLRFRCSGTPALLGWHLGFGCFLPCTFLRRTRARRLLRLTLELFFAPDHGLYLVLELLQLLDLCLDLLDTAQDDGQVPLMFCGQRPCKTKPGGGAQCGFVP